MNAKTLRALQGSIRKWEKILLGTGTDLGHNNCPLCKLFHKHDCKGCPVQEETGQRWCAGTPYEAWSDAQQLVGDKPSRNKNKLFEARRELDFLRSLLPQKEKPQ